MDKLSGESSGRRWRIRRLVTISTMCYRLSVQSSIDLYKMASRSFTTAQTTVPASRVAAQGCRLAMAPRQQPYVAQHRSSTVFVEKMISSRASFVGCKVWLCSEGRIAWL